MGKPTMNAVATAIIMMTRDVRVPYRVRENTSRPMASVPMRCQYDRHPTVMPMKSMVRFPAPALDAWVMRTWSVSRVRSEACQLVTPVRSLRSNASTVDSLARGGETPISCPCGIALVTKDEHLGPRRNMDRIGRKNGIEGRDEIRPDSDEEKGDQQP